MGLFGGLFESNSSTKSSQDTTDNKVAADNGALAARIQTSTGMVNIGSDNVATAAITASTSALENNKAVLGTTLDFISQALTGLYNQVDHRAAAADQNLQAAQQLAANVVTKSQQTDTDSIIKLVSILAASFIGYKIFVKGR